MTVKYYGHIIRKKFTIPCHTGTLYTPNNTTYKEFLENQTYNDYDLSKIKKKTIHLYL